MNDNFENGVVNFKYNIFTANEFLAQELPPVEYLLYPFIPKNGISLLYAERGAGKTFMAMAMACAVASGFDFLNFKADKPHKVLYVDGEMDAREMQDRLNTLIDGFAQDGKIVKKENLKLFLSGLQNDNSMPDLSTEQGQIKFESEIGDAELIIIDNIYALYLAGRENDSDSWIPYNTWSKQQRAKGRSILWLHHTGKDKGRGPRGSSAIEAFLNSSLALEVASEHKLTDGAGVSVEYHKARGVAGEDVRGFYAKLSSEKDDFGNVCSLKWITAQKPKNDKLDEIIKLYQEGNTLEQIADVIGMSKSTIQRRLKDAGIEKPKPKSE